ncbi:hypothetical protein [Salinibacter grassmerensis]|uniref:hypothetical protein n=1 Tax=Salinibacter grassmerensis TaxID=3040353 RepID=UPI0021E84020|nr:hypothetical protein [Salinibacter grassmerensis]
MSAVSALLRFNSRVFDVFEEWWEGQGARRMVAGVLVGGFVVSLVAIELSRMGWLPEAVGSSVSTNHFRAIDVAFTLFLVVELVGLVVGLATSVADTAGKQFEVFSLILLRRSFKELVKFEEEPIRWSMEAGREAVQYLVVDATAALLIFVILGVFYKVQVHQPITESEGEEQFFVRQKKLVANGLLLILSGLSVYAVAAPLFGGEAIPFFNTFYTVLIFSDILIVLMSLRHSVTYHVVFRNSGFAAATVMIRLALSGPRYLGAALGVGAALFNLGVAAAYYYVTPAAQASTERNREQKAFDDASATEPADTGERSAAADPQSTPGV